jgi:hypothetical protein
MVVWQYLHPERQLMAGLVKELLLFGLSSPTGLNSNSDYCAAPAHRLRVLKVQK